MRFHKKHLKKCAVGVLAAVGILTVGFAANQAFADERDDTILDNVYIGEVPVGGMGEEEARKAVTDYVSGIKDTVFTLTVNDRKMTATAGQLGVEWENTKVVEEAVMIGKSGSLITRYKDKKDLEHEPKILQLSFGTDEAKTEKYLAQNAKKVNRKAVDGSLVRENGAFTITDGKEGIAVNAAESAKAVAEYISNDWDMKEASIELAADIVQPRGSREALSKVKDVLGTFSTDYSSSAAGRAMNVTNGCARIDGTLLYPGEGFSVYEKVAPFDAEHGYALAASYENSTVVESYGGGICQVSTTLYNAAIRAEMEITERYEHSMTVAYVEPSMDAAIAGTVKDLKFKNNTDAPVYIEGITGGGIITFNIYGEETRAANREVIFESEIVRETEAPTQIQGSASYNVGYVSVQQSTHGGKVAKLWKVIKVDGKEQSREEFNNSTYLASPRVIVVGTNTANDAARAYIQSAIASQNEGNIYAAAQTAATIAAQPQEPEEPSEDEEDPEKEDGKKEDNKKDNTGKGDKKDTGKKSEDKKEEKKEVKKEAEKETTKEVNKKEADADKASISSHEGNKEETEE